MSFIETICGCIFGVIVGVGFLFLVFGIDGGFLLLSDLKKEWKDPKIPKYMIILTILIAFLIWVLFEWLTGRLTFSK